MIMKKYLSFFAAALLLAACQSDDIADQKESYINDGSIQFGVKSTQELTRTPGSTVGVIGGDITTGETPIHKVKYWDPVAGEYKLAGFGVFGLYTHDLVYENATVQPDFMYNQQVIPVDEDATTIEWTYNPVKYWPNTGKTTFFAYAPYIATEDIDFEYPEKSYNIAGMSNPYDLGDPWLIYVLNPNPFDKFSGQRDLLYGVNHADSDNPWYNVEKATHDDKMEFTFKHALGIIGDKIRIRVSDELQAKLITDKAKIYIDHIDMKFKNLTRKAKLVLNSKQGYPNWKPIVSGEVTTDREYTITREDIIEVDSKYAATQGLDLDQSYYNSVEGITADNTSEDPGDHKDGLVLLTTKGLMFIPYQVAEQPQTVEVTLHYQVLSDGMEAYNGTATSFTEIMTEDGQVADICINLGEDMKYDRIYAPKIGDAYFSDGTWGNNPHAYGATPIGIVAYIGDDIKKADGTMAPHGLILSMQDARLPNFALQNEIPNDYDLSQVQDLMALYGWNKLTAWTYYYNNVLTAKSQDLYHKCTYFSYGGLFYSAVTSFADAYNDVDGEKHTHDLISIWDGTGYEVIRPRQDAAYLCAMYDAEGVGARGNWHMGSFGEWIRIFDACAKVSIPSWSTDHLATIAQSGNLVEGELYYTTAKTDERLLMPQAGNTVHTGINNWIQIACSYNAPTGHPHPYDLLETEATYWTSTIASQYYSYSFRLRWEQQDVSFFGKDNPRAQVSHEWNAKEPCLVRPLMTF